MKIEFDSKARRMTVNGVGISFELLEDLTNPNPRKAFLYERIGDVVIVHSFSAELLAAVVYDKR